MKILLKYSCKIHFRLEKQQQLIDQNLNVNFSFLLFEDLLNKKKLVKKQISNTFVFNPINRQKSFKGNRKRDKEGEKIDKQRRSMAIW